MTKRSYKIMCLFVALVFNRAGLSSEEDKKLVLIQGTVLHAYSSGEYREVKRAALFYGYGWLDNNRVFLAYQPEGEAEAIAEIEVFDTRYWSAKKITTIGGVGESNFDVGASGGSAVFNDSDGVKSIKIRHDNSYEIALLKKGENCWGVFWVSEGVVGCLAGQSDRRAFKRIDVREKK